MGKKFTRAVVPILSLVLVCLFPCAFLFFQNAGEAHWRDMLPFFGIFLLTGAAMLAAGLAVLRNVARACLAADFGVLAAAYFTMVCNAIKGVAPWFRDMMLLIPLLALLLGLVIWLGRKKPRATVPCGLIALMFGAMILVSAVPAIPTLIAASRYEKSAVAVDESLAGRTFQGEKRNFYYLIFDEFGGPENLRHYYGDGSEAFFSGLAARGFSVSRTSRNTESPWTVTLVPNMMNLQYVTGDEIPINNRLEWLERPALYELFWNNGYTINLVNQDGFLGEDGCRVLTRDQREDTISVFLYENSIFCLIPRLKNVIEERVLHRGRSGPIASLRDAQGAMIRCADEAGDGPTLTVCYLIAPHAPFLFDENGAVLPKSEQYNWRRPELYLAKLADISEAILETVDHIQKTDPEAVIVLQADHGARTPGHLVYYFGGPWFDTEAEIPYMENVLCCVYLPGGTVDIEGDSCINALRKTLDAAYGTGLGEIQQPPDYEIPPEYMPPEPERETEG